MNSKCSAQNLAPDKVLHKYWLLHLVLSCINPFFSNPHTQGTQADLFACHHQLQFFHIRPQSLKYPTLHDSDSISLLLSVSGDHSFQSKFRCLQFPQKSVPRFYFFICLPHVEPHEGATAGDLTVSLLSRLEPIGQRARIFELGGTLASFNLR